MLLLPLDERKKTRRMMRRMNLSNERGDWLSGASLGSDIGGAFREELNAARASLARGKVISLAQQKSVYNRPLSSVGMPGWTLHRRP